MTNDSGTDGQVGRPGLALVNGPEDGDLDWLSVDWQTVEDDVRRLRQRIFTASRDGDLAKVRNLQKLMLRSRANALISVRRVTELNTGRKAAGVDGQVVVTAPGKAVLAERVQHHRNAWTPKPVKRVYVPKANRKRRPLGIPTVPAEGPCFKVEPGFGFDRRGSSVPSAGRPEAAGHLREEPAGSGSGAGV